MILPERDTDPGKARFYKFHKSDGTFIKRWEEGTFWSLSLYPNYFYKDQLVFNNRGEKITAIDINTMETAWEIITPYIHSYIYPLDNKVFGVQFIDGKQVYWEFNLDTKKSRKVYSSDPIETGIFASASRPTFYVNEKKDTVVSVTTTVDSSFILASYNITADSLLWEKELVEFNENAFKPPRRVFSVDSLLIINSNDYLSCRNAKNGNLYWNHSINSNPIAVISNPLVTSIYTFYGGDRLNCIETKTDNEVWTHEDGENGIQTGGANRSMNYKGHVFFFGPIPFNMETGYPHWKNGNLGFSTGSKNPGVDMEEDKLYYTGNGKIYCVKTPYD